MGGGPASAPVTGAACGGVPRDGDAGDVRGSLAELPLRAVCGSQQSVHLDIGRGWGPVDIDADGDLDHVSWTGAGSDVAFLALDRNGDGRITSGRELIGGHTLRGVRNGPNALIALANEALGGEPGAVVVDSQNPLLFKLLLWTDANHNGISEAAELVSAHHVVSDIGLGYQRHHREDRHGNESRYRGFVHVRTEPGLNRVTTPEEDVGRRRSMYDVCLVTR